MSIDRDLDGFRDENLALITDQIFSKMFLDSLHEH